MCEGPEAAPALSRCRGHPGRYRNPLFEAIDTRVDPLPAAPLPRLDRALARGRVEAVGDRVSAAPGAEGGARRHGPGPRPGRAAARCPPGAGAGRGPARGRRAPVLHLERQTPGRHATAFDIDHCFPRAVRSCEDLWNPLPAGRPVNHRKGARIPDAGTLQAAGEFIKDSRRRAWLQDGGSHLPKRFHREVSATLAGLSEPEVRDLEDVFSGVALRRMRLRQDQRVPESGLGDLYERRAPWRDGVRVR